MKGKVKYYFSKIKNNKLRLNIVFNFLLKGFSIVINFLTIPLMLNYLNSEEYGLWILILSITNWIYTFDIGIGNGLKNKIAQYLNLKNYNEIKKYIITSYFFVVILSVIIFSFICILFNILDLNTLLKINFLNRNELLFLMVINVGFVCFNFILSLCNNIFIGSQKIYLSGLNNILSQILNFIFIGILYLKEEKSIFYLSISYGISMSISHIIFTIFYFNKNKILIPKISDVSLEKLHSVLNIGGKIFITQIAELIIFSTDNFIISNFLGPEMITEYNIVYKFFSIPLITINLILGPIWPEATKEYYCKNYKWFKNILKKLEKIFILLILGMLLMICIGKKFIYIWTTYKVDPSILLVIITSISVMLTCYSSIYATILVGINEINFLMTLAIIQAIMNIFLSYIFIKYTSLGVNGVILATCFCMVTNIFTLPKVLKNKLEKIKR
ncbi:oligosaccharide flippase family protein [Fusobacterium varium]|uniref:lipopolysaccharide biosynthesis protein n=1 Tax=Fusobacterium varium TaxID=856 RepID=UPI0022E628DF|nr:oligosaccharide flippase family protein [Fusobacterium varium]